MKLRQWKKLVSRDNRRADIGVKRIKDQHDRWTTDAWLADMVTRIRKQDERAARLVMDE